jgi:D-xylonolactonase
MERKTMSQTTAPEIELLVNEHCQVGENPLWDERRNRLYWTDILGGKLYYWDAASARHQQIYEGEIVGGFTFQEDGALLLFRVNNIALLSDDGKVRVLRDGIDKEMDRFNDVIADPAGRVYAGTSATDLRGGLYRVERDLTVKRLFQESDCSNGMGFTPDLRQMYWTDTTANRIYRFDYDQSTGELSERTTLVQVKNGEGLADGMTVDAAGNLWSARLDGACIHCHSPTGEVLRTIKFAVAKTSSITFGGENLTDMFITTAGGNGAVGADHNPLNGALFRVRSNVRGRTAFRSRIEVR